MHSFLAHRRRNNHGSRSPITGRHSCGNRESPFDWIDPLETPLNWSCTLYNSEGFEIGNGNAHTPREAMALAWIACCSPDALIDGYVEPGSVPYEVPEGYRFELTPPWKSKRD